MTFFTVLPSAVNVCQNLYKKKKNKNNKSSRIRLVLPTFSCTFADLIALPGNLVQGRWTSHGNAQWLETTKNMFLRKLSPGWGWAGG